MALWQTKWVTVNELIEIISVFIHIYIDIVNNGKVWFLERVWLIVWKLKHVLKQTGFKRFTYKNFDLFFFFSFYYMFSNNNDKTAYYWYKFSLTFLNSYWWCGNARILKCNVIKNDKNKVKVLVRTFLSHLVCIMNYLSVHTHHFSGSSKDRLDFTQLHIVSLHTKKTKAMKHYFRHKKRFSTRKSCLSLIWFCCKVFV